jgi:hypothetical protein
MCLLLGVGVGVHGGGAEHDDGDRGGEQGGVLFPGGADRKVVRHCKEQECGVGEVPTLPKIITTFSYLGKGEIIATTDLLKAQAAICFSKVIMFLTLIKIKKRTVLED